MKRARTSSIVKLRLRLGACVSATLLALAALASAAAQAQTLAALHDFTGGMDGAGPEGLVAVDHGANVYGSAPYGGSRAGICAAIGGCGAAFRASFRDGAWIFAPLYEFQGGNDGGGPLAGVTLGPDGAVYGTTLFGGGTACGGNGCGTVFKLRPPAQFCRMALCPWTETVLYRNTTGSGGLSGFAGGVIVDNANNVYGMSAGGGSYSAGAVYKLSPAGGGTYTETVIYSFRGTDDGADPLGDLGMDAAGNLYGTATFGGTLGYGTVFKLTRSAGGYTFHLLYTFTGGADGANPQGNVVLDSAGNVYGASGNGGGIFQITPSGTYTLIDPLRGGTQAPINISAAGNIYGTTYSGGTRGDGSLFELSYANGVWTHTVLYSFGGVGGALPLSGVGFDSSGNLYGTSTYGGGPSGDGVLWQFTP